MDLGIAGRAAIVCASSRGLGRACAEALLREGVDVVISGRIRESLDKTTEELRAIAGGRGSARVRRDVRVPVQFACRLRVLPEFPSRRQFASGAGLREA
jgi:3-oxoacyl-[acyl-carrier protein] reductase